MILECETKKAKNDKHRRLHTDGTASNCQIVQNAPDRLAKEQPISMQVQYITKSSRYKHGSHRTTAIISHTTEDPSDQLRITEAMSTQQASNDYPETRGCGRPRVHACRLSNR